MKYTSKQQNIKHMKIHKISSKELTFKQVNEILTKGYKLELSADAIKRIQKCRDYLDKKMENPEKPIYGVTTGFGSQIGRAHV